MHCSSVAVLRSCGQASFCLDPACHCDRGAGQDCNRCGPDFACQLTSHFTFLHTKVAIEG